MPYSKREGRWCPGLATWDWEAQDWTCLDIPVPEPPPEPEEPMPEIHKPQWLIDFLASPLLNFDIFTWHIGIGETIESAVDWVLKGVNDVISFVVKIWNKANAAWDKAVEVGTSVLNSIDKVASDLSKFISSVPDLVKRGVDALKPWVEGAISRAISTVSNFISWLENVYNSLVAKVENIIFNVLPNIFTKSETSDFVHSETDPLKDEVAKQKGFLLSMLEFWNNPILWLWDRFNTWFWGGA